MRPKHTQHRCVPEWKRKVPSDRVAPVPYPGTHNLNVLSAGFARHFPVSANIPFCDLLSQLEQVAGTPPDGPKVR
jgi:hypothetical protein